MPVPALVDEDIQQAAIARFQQQSTERQRAVTALPAGTAGAPSASGASGASGAPRLPREAREDALLAGGYVRCAYCGHSMAVQRVKNVRNGQSDYFCTHVKARGWTGNACCRVASNNVAVKKLDTLVWNQLLAGLKEPAVLEALLTEASTTVSTMEAQTGRLAETVGTRLARLESDMAALVQQSLDPNLNAVVRSYLTERMIAWGDDIAQAKDSLAAELELLARHEGVQERTA